MTEDRDLHPLKDIQAQIRKRRIRLAYKVGYLELLRNLLVMALLIYLAFTQLFLITTAHGTDMFPAVLDGDIVLGYRIDRSYVKNDVVVCEVDGRQVIGRVVARAGDSVNITEGGTLYVNGTEQQGEIAFLTLPPEGSSYPINVPEGCVYLLGDYRTHTKDSRDFGPVPVSDVKAKVVSIFRRRGI